MKDAVVAEGTAFSGGLSVLVVEDNPAEKDWLAETLALAGHQVRRAPSGAAALAEMAEDPAEVVVSDISLPGMSGLDFLARTRKRWPLTKVVLITGEGDLGTSRRALALGAHSYLLKPLGAQELLSCVRKAGTEHRHLVEDHLRLCRLQWQNQKLNQELARLREAHDSLARDHEDLLLAERRAAVEQVVVTVNHVINNSLAGIGAALRLVAREADRLGEDARLALGIIEQEAETIVGLMRDLRDLRQVVGVPYFDDVKMLDLSSAASPPNGPARRRVEGEAGADEVMSDPAHAVSSV